MQFVKELENGTDHKNVLFSYYVSNVENQCDGVHCLTVISFFGAGSFTENMKRGRFI